MTDISKACFTFNFATRDEYDDFCWFEQFLSRDEVARTLEAAAAVEPESAAVGDDRAINEAIRASVVRWIHPNADNVALFDRIGTLVKGCNDVRYGFDLWAMTEGLQIAEYRPGDFFEWHKDHGKGARRRRSAQRSFSLPS